MKIKQVIVVEGKTDTTKLKKIYGNNNVDTIETNGLSLNIEKLKLINDVNKTRGIIVFTDPDNPGNIIRDKINNYLNYKCLNAFIKKEYKLNLKVIGIAEASETVIKKALENLISFNSENKSIDWFTYLDNNFNNPIIRKKIARKFNWNENINSKKFFQWINFNNLNKEDLFKILEK